MRGAVATPGSGGAQQAGVRPDMPLPAAVDERLDRLAELIATAPVNLVSVAERRQVRARHIDEAVAAADVIPCRAGEHWMDLGTGGGLPGLVLAVCHDDISWTLVDSTRKKTRQVERFAAQLDLDNVRVVTGRAEVLGHSAVYRGRCDGVVARAVAPLAVLAELARGFLRHDGTLAALKGPAWEEESAAAEAAYRVLGYGNVHSTVLPSQVRRTWVVTIRARGAPPAGFPRRDGMPRADPLH